LQLIDVIAGLCWVNKLDFYIIRMNCETVSQAVRALLLIIFKTNALIICTVEGSSKGPRLNPAGVQAVIGE
jgi:hypothetical protein